MVKKFLSCAVVIFAVVSFTTTYAVAQSGAAEDPKVKLREVQAKKYILTNKNSDEIQKANKEADEKIAVVKADFHAKRNEINKERDSRIKASKDSYKDDMAPLVAEEKRLMEELKPEGKSNFAKPKVEGKKKKSKL